MAEIKKEKETEVTPTMLKIEELVQNLQDAEAATINNIETDKRNYPQELAFKIEDEYLAIQECDDGFDYTFFDGEYNLVDGGVYDDVEVNIYQAINEILEPEKGFALWETENVIQVNYQELMENTDNVEMAKIQSAKVTFAMPDNCLNGERIQTPRGSFALTAMTMEQMEACGYGVQHNSKDGKYAIMDNGTRAFAVSIENSLENAELQAEQNCNMIDGIINNEDDTKKSVLAQLNSTQTPKKAKPTPKKDIDRDR